MLQHMELVAVSTAAAALVGIPAGILAFHRPKLGRPVLFVANVAQTIPSLALLGFLLPLPFIGGIGPRTALVTLDHLRVPADRPDDGRWAARPRPFGRGGRRGDGDDAAPALAPGGAAAGHALDRGRTQSRHRDRRRNRHRCGRDRRRRARRVHLSRVVDGGHHDDPRRSDSCGSARAGRRRWPGVAGASHAASTQSGAWSGTRGCRDAGRSSCF